MNKNKAKGNGKITTADKAVEAEVRRQVKVVEETKAKGKEEK